MAEKNTKAGSRTNKGRKTTELAIPGFSFPSMFGEFMRPFDDIMAPIFSGSTSRLWTELSKKTPTVELQDRGDHFVLTAELPGFEKKDVEVHVNSNVLELKAERRTEEGRKKAEGRKSSYSYFQRYLTLPERVVSGKVDGTMKNGILELKLPKTEPKPKDTSRRVHLN